MAVDYEEGRRALEALQKDIDGFDRAVAEHLDEETERADLWTEIEVNAETLRSALTCLKALLNPDPWRPIEEAPTDGKSVLLACDYDRHGKQRVTLAWWDDQFDKSEISGCWIEGWFYDYQEDENTPMRVEFRPTHWKPLPTPPEKEGPGQ